MLVNGSSRISCCQLPWSVYCAKPLFVAPVDTSIPLAHPFQCLFKIPARGDVAH
jgi:hypothetical protein